MKTYSIMQKLEMVQQLINSGLISHKDAMLILNGINPDILNSKLGKLFYL